MKTCIQKQHLHIKKNVPENSTKLGLWCENVYRRNEDGHETLMVMLLKITSNKIIWEETSNK